MRRQVTKFIILFIIIAPISLKASTDFDKMVKIEKGFFQAGCDKKEIVQHNRVGVKTVFLDTYWIDKYEVTNLEYEKFDKNHNRSLRSNCDNCPVTRVGWLHGKEYCVSLGKDLPTEAQWEKAAGAKSGCDYVWGDKMFESSNRLAHAGYNKDDKINTAPVGSYPPNRFGVYDMAGNVWEWTNNWLETSIKDFPKDEILYNPKGPDRGIKKIRRGGSWNDSIEGLIVAWRDWSFSDSRYYADLGFRCVYNLPEK